MSIASSVNLKGVVEIERRRRDDGRLVDRVQVENRIVDYGLDLLSRLVVSAFINDAVENFDTLPLQGIGVGNPNPPVTDEVSFAATSLDAEWKRQRIEQVEILSATHDIKQEGDPATTVLRLWSKVHGAYGNRIQITVDSASDPYRIEVSDINTGRVTTYEETALADLLAAMQTDPTVAASAPDLSWSDNLELDTAGTLMSGGGGGVVVSTTFNNAGSEPVELTEAALFTEDTLGQGIMFNMVRFPVITVTSDLDITFRWKLLFQESA